MTLHRTIVALLIIAVVLLLAACDVIDLDATTRTEPTPPLNHDSEMAAHEARIEAKQTQEAR